MDDIMHVAMLTVLLIAVAVGIIMLVLVYQKKQLQYLNEKEQMKARFDKEILASKLEIQEQTMRHISQEVHDNIGQVLSVVKLNLNLIDCSEPKTIIEWRISDTEQLVGKAIQDLRNLSKSLDGNNIANKGLLKSIEFEFSMLNKTGVYVTHLTTDGEPYPLPEQKELILFRIFQETINNVLKHAKATAVTVQIRFKTDEFFMSIRDNGQGFNTSEMPASNGLGLRNMATRSKLIGALYRIESAPGTGTTVTVTLPVAESALL